MLQKKPVKVVQTPENECIPDEYLLEVFQAGPIGRRFWDISRARWRDYISHPVYDCLGICQEVLEDVAGERGTWAALLRMDGLMKMRSVSI